MENKPEINRIKKNSKSDTSYSNPKEDVTLSKEMLSMIESAFTHLQHIYKFTDYIKK
jgi:hypothetical protein